MKIFEIFDFQDPEDLPFLPKILMTFEILKIFKSFGILKIFKFKIPHVLRLLYISKIEGRQTKKKTELAPLLTTI